jgi:hypothetical protein
MLGTKRKGIHSRMSKQIEESNNMAILDMDLLHECVSPPTELSDGNNESKTF